MKGERSMNKAVQGAARLISFAILLLFTGCPDLFHDKEPEKPKEYTVTFDATGGSPETQTRTVREGASLDSSGMPASPGRDGYVFDGWYTEADGEGSEFSAGTTVNEDITVYARWTAPPGSHTVTFKLNNGTNTNWAAKIVISGGTTGVGDFPDDPSRPGYTFAGWNTAAAGSGTPFTASTPVNANLTIYAQWTAASPGSYTVAFNLNDGTSTTWAAKTVSSGATTGTEDFPANPSRPGYVFGGWNTQADGEGTIFSASTAVNADITVYAQWTETPAGLQTVIFKLNDETETIWAAESVTDPGTPVTAFPVPPSRLRYTFTGWYTAVDGGGSEFTASTAVSGNIIVYAQWTGETYTVTFMSNYGTNETLYTKTVTVPATTILITDFPADPDRPGYNFGGWNTQANGSGSGFTASTAVTGDITVYAQWTGQTYTVTFKSNYDTNATLDTKTVTVPVTTIADFPADPSRLGYNFGGWNTQADGGGNSFTASTVVSDNITIYAKWNTYSYMVTFNNNGGDTAAVPAVKTVTSPVTNVGALPNPPSRMGYIFGGWNTAPAGSGNGFTASTAVSDDITVYAQWTGETYTVTFKSNYDANATLYTKTVTVPVTTIADFPADPSRTGYNFGGWNTQADGGGNSFTASTAVTGSITIYAQWDTYLYTVTFNKNGGDTEAVPAAKTVASPEISIDALPDPPSRSGYIFAGWNTAPAGSGNGFTAATTVNDNITVYAQWTGETYMVTFKSNYDANATLYTKTVTVPAMTIADFPTNPTRTGYIFGYWNTQADGGGSGFTASTAVTGSITVYAQWNTYSYMVTFDKNGGDTEAVPAIKTVASPEISIDALPEPPARTGYSFAGWNTAPAGSGSVFTAETPVSGNITVYARWTGALITLNPDAGDGAFSQGTFTLSKNGDESQTISITGSGYTNPRWLVDGDLRGMGTSIIIEAADYGIGGHNLSLIINKSGVTWSKDITFTVTN
jgi:uncharacterized repeat protein (TIGR02543 family)